MSPTKSDPSIASCALPMGTDPFRIHGCVHRKHRRFMRPSSTTTRTGSPEFHSDPLLTEIVVAETCTARCVYRGPGA